MKTCPSCGSPMSPDAKRTCRACYAMPIPDLVEELQLLANEAPERAAQRLGTNTAALARRLYRAGRPDLARPFSAAQKRQASRKAAA